MEKPLYWKLKMVNTNDYIDRYVKKTGLIREKTSEKQATTIDKIKVFYSFGDIDSTILYNKTVCENIVFNKDYYNILLGWKGMSCFAPSCIDEYWSFGDDNVIKTLYGQTRGINNVSESIFSLARSLNENFVNVEKPSDYKKYYTNYLTNDYKNRCKTFKLKYPSIVSPSYLNNNLIEKIKSGSRTKITFCPFLYSYMWQNNEKYPIKKEEEIVVHLVEILCKYFDVICVQNDFTFDLSSKVKNDNIIFIKEGNFDKLLSLINLSDMYFDFLSNTFTVGFMAQKFTFSVVDKPSWLEFKKYEDFELLGNSKNYFNVPSFNYFPVMDKKTNLYFFEGIARKIKEAYNSLDKSGVDVLKETSFDLENLSKAKLSYIQKRKVFFTRSQ